MRPLFAVAVLALLLTGCRNQADAGEELNYLRTEPEEYSPERVDTKDLLPLKAGGRWEYDVKRSKGEPSRENVVVTSTNGKGTILESWEKGKVVSRDQYRVDDKGVWVTAVMIDEKMMPITPDMPLLSLPIEEEKVNLWQGTIGSGKTTMAGRVWIRTTRRQKLKTPAGEFMAYRVDMRSELSGQGRNATLLASRWFAPGVGIVKVRAVDSKVTLVKELLSQKSRNSSVTTEVK